MRQFDCMRVRVYMCGCAFERACVMPVAYTRCVNLIALLNALINPSKAISAYEVKRKLCSSCSFCIHFLYDHYHLARHLQAAPVTDAVLWWCVCVCVCVGGGGWRLVLGFYWYVSVKHAWSWTSDDRGNNVTIRKTWLSFEPDPSESEALCPLEQGTRPARSRHCKRILHSV